MVTLWGGLRSGVTVSRGRVHGRGRGDIIGGDMGVATIQSWAGPVGVVTVTVWRGPVGVVTVPVWAGLPAGQCSYFRSIAQECQISQAAAPGSTFPTTHTPSHTHTYV